MSTHNLIKDAGNKFFSKTKCPSPVEQIILETQWTDNLQRLVDFGNRRYLKNFFLRLEMEEDNDV